MNGIDDYFEILNEFIFDEKKIVTYKYLTVTLGVDTSIAKRMLYTYHTHEKEKGREIYATYFLSGLAPANTFGLQTSSSTDKGETKDDKDSGSYNEQFILLCGCSKYEEIKTKFTKLLKVYVYTLSATPVEDFQELKFSPSLPKSLPRQTSMCL